MKYTFQHFVDLKTSGDSMQIIQIQAGGSYALQRVKHLLGAFKYMKLGKIHIKLLPASTLPIDVLGLSYNDDDPNTIDPRDQMNPGLVRITNGEDIFTNVSTLSENAQMSIYNNMMLDARWSKFMLQSGFKRSATPLYWQIGQLHQDYYPGATINVPQMQTSTLQTLSTTGTEYNFSNNQSGVSSAAALFVKGNSDPRGLFQVGHRGKLGWLPTDALIQYPSGATLTEQPALNALPSVNCITVVLPKAYKTVYYYRMFITETVYFAGLKNTGINGTDDLEYRGIDNFMGVYPAPMYPNIPTGLWPPLNSPPSEQNDGENND